MAISSLPSPSGVPKVRRSNEINRAAVLDQLRQAPQHRMSFDAIQQQQQLILQQQQQQHQQPHQLPQQHQQHQQQQAHSIPAAPFVANFQELLPLDIPSATNSPESSGTPSTSQRSAGGYPLHHTPNASMGSGGGIGLNNAGVSAGGPSVPVSDGSTSATTNPLYKLDAMLFPSSDPFAYPSQPIMDFGLQDLMGDMNGGNSAGGTSSNGSGGGGDGHGAPNSADGTSHGQQQHPDAMQFFAPSMYSEIEGQLLGSAPPYLMQPSGAPAGIDLASEMYSASSLLTLQQAQAHNAQQQQQAAHAHHQRQQQQQHHQQQQQHQQIPQQHQQHQHGVDDMFADNNFNDIFAGQYQQRP